MTNRDQSICADCGSRTFFNHAIWSSGPDGGKHHHGGPEGCKRAYEFRHQDGMVDHYGFAIQAHVEISEALGRFISESDDEEYADVERLQELILFAYARASDGIAGKAPEVVA